MLAFLVLEVTLRLLGSQFQPLDAGDAPLRHTLADEGKTVILCYGDSVTYGIGAVRGHGYPSQLEELLNTGHEDAPFVVINGALAGANAAMLRSRLPTYLEAARPDVVVLLAGCANATNFFGYGSFARRDTVLYTVTDALFEIRTLRLVRTFFTLLRHRQPEGVEPILDGTEAAITAYLKWHTSSRPDEALSEHFLSGIDWMRLGQFERAWKDFDLGRSEFPDQASHYWGLGLASKGLRQREQALEWYTACVGIDPANPACYCGGGEAIIESGQGNLDERNWFENGVAADPSFACNYWGLGMITKPSGPPGEHVDWFLRCIEADPNDCRCYPNLVADSRLDPSIQERVEGTLEEHAGESRCAEDSLRMLQVGMERDDINAWIGADLKAMTEMSEERGARVILQEYPSENPLNAHLREIAAESDVAFVEQRASFAAQSLGTGDHPNLFSPDGSHPNELGYRLMAANLAPFITGLDIGDRGDAQETVPAD
jgi:lysophospholipase L1-like esterase